MKLIITAPADEIFQEALFWEVEAPFDANGIPVTIADWQRQELAKRMKEVFTDLTGRSCSAVFEDDDKEEQEDDDPDGMNEFLNGAQSGVFRCNDTLMHPAQEPPVLTDIPTRTD